MSWWSRLFARKRKSAIAEAKLGGIDIVGDVEGLELLPCPLTGESSVLAQYRAYVPGFATRAYGLGGDSMNLVADTSEAREFILKDHSGRALVRVQSATELAGLHAQLVSQHGFDLKAECSLIRPGDRVRIRGQVHEITRGSPMRRADYDIVIDADDFEVLV